MKKRISGKAVDKNFSKKTVRQAKEKKLQKPDEPSSPVCYAGRGIFREGFEDLNNR